MLAHDRGRESEKSIGAKCGNKGNDQGDAKRLPTTSELAVATTTNENVYRRLQGVEKTRQQARRTASKQNFAFDPVMVNFLPYKEKKKDKKGKKTKDPRACKNARDEQQARYLLLDSYAFL